MVLATERKMFDLKCLTHHRPNETNYHNLRSIMMEILTLKRMVYDRNWDFVYVEP